MDTDAKLELDGLVHEHDRGMAGGMVVCQGGNSFKMGDDVHQALTAFRLNRYPLTGFTGSSG